MALTKTKVIKYLSQSFPKFADSLKTGLEDKSLRSLIKDEGLDIQGNATLNNLLEDEEYTLSLYIKTFAGFNSYGQVIKGDDKLEKTNIVSQLNKLALYNVLDSNVAQKVEPHITSMLNADDKLAYDFKHHKFKAKFIKGNSCTLLLFIYLPLVDLDAKAINKLYDVASNLGELDDESAEYQVVLQAYNKLLSTISKEYDKPDLVKWSNVVESTYLNTYDKDIHNKVLLATKMRFLKLI